MSNITADTARRVLEIVDAGLVRGVVQILVAMQAPGCKWLPLTEVAK